MKNKNTFEIVLVVSVSMCMFACSMLIDSSSVDDGQTTPESTQIQRPTETIPAPIIPSTSTTDESPVKQDDLHSYWAIEAEADLGVDLAMLATGIKDSNLCDEPGTAWYNPNSEHSSGEYFLTLRYAYGIIPHEIHIYFNRMAEVSMRVEAMDSSSGVGFTAYKGTLNMAENCPTEYVIPVESDLGINTLILAFEGESAETAVDAVEIIGSPAYRMSYPVFWRIPIPHDNRETAESRFPGGMALDSINNLYLANGHKGLLRYDVEGNLLQEYTVPEEYYLSDIAVNLQDQVVVTDSVNQRFITLAADGQQISTGGEDFNWDYPKEAGINPQDGYLYLLDENTETARFRVYDSSTAQWIRDVPLQSSAAGFHQGLAFDAEGYLYTTDPLQAGILKIDSQSGKIIETLGEIPLAGAGCSDLALDADGNIYVLLNNSADDSAVYVLDPAGTLTQRFGRLTYDDTGWQEGTFSFPINIAVTPDGLFVLICENEYLSAYWLQE